MNVNAVQAEDQYAIERLSPFGAVVRGVDLRRTPSAAIITALEREAATNGFLVFPNLSLPGNTLSTVAQYFGSGLVAARHTAHGRATSEDVLRLSNDPVEGITGVGPQWHNDGNFE